MSDAKPDLVVTCSGEFDVAEIEGVTSRGIEFVDAWLDSQVIVVDAGRIVIPLVQLGYLRQIATSRGLVMPL
jgi:hypothetical protein